MALSKLQNEILAEPPLGSAGQTWQDVTGSRATGVTYTNTSGRPIEVSVEASRANGNVLDATVSGILVSRVDQDGTSGVGCTMTFIVPNGDTYIVSGTSIIDNWVELR